MAELFTKEPEISMSNELVTVETSPLTILQLAVERGADADALEKLAGLIERRERWDAERAFNEAMNECQKALPAIVRNAYNKQTESWYAQLDMIGDLADPVILEHGFAPSYGTEPSHVEGWIRIVCDLLHRGGHTKRYHLDLPPDDAGIKGTKNKTMVHAVGSTYSYGERYLLCGIFKIRLKGRDKDGNPPVDVIGPEEIRDLNDLIARAAEALAKPPRDVLGTILKAYEIQSLAALPSIHLTDAKTRLHKLIKT